jgi:hypothetical protein
MAGNSTRGKERKSCVKRGDTVIYKGKRYSVADILSKTDSRSPNSIKNKPQISVYKMKGNTVLKNSSFYAGTDYEIEDQ